MDEMDTSQNASNDDAESNDEHVSNGKNVHIFRIYLHLSFFMSPKVSSSYTYACMYKIMAKKMFNAYSFFSF